MKNEKSLRDLRRPLLLLFLLSLFFHGMSASAEQPPNPITGRVTITGTETWDKDIVFDGKGQVDIEGGNLTISGSKISFRSSYSNASPAFNINRSGTLKLCDGSVSDLSNLKFYYIENYTQSNLILDHAEITGQKAGWGTIFSHNSSNVTITGSSIRNNSLSWARGGVFLLHGGTLTIEDSEISGNEITMETEFQFPFRSGIIGAHSDAAVTIRNSRFENNTVNTGGVINVDSLQALTIDATLFSGNRQTGSGEYGSVIKALNTPVTIISGNQFTNNSAPEAYGAVYTVGNTLEIGDGNSFTGNTADQGGAIHTEDSDLTIGKNNLFSDNSSTLEGGAVYAVNCKASVNEGTEFTNNRSEDNGGAIYSARTNNDHETELVINGANFFSNYSGFGGGAINVGWPYGYPVQDYDVFINKAVFRENVATGGGAGALYAGPRAVTHMNRLVIRSNTGGTGGAFWSNGGASTQIFDRNGAAIFDNVQTNPHRLSYQEDIYGEVYQGGTFYISERMFNGGSHRWIIDDLGGYVFYGSDPTSRDITGYNVLMENNRGYYLEQPDDGYGGALMVAGTLIVGEEGTSLSLRKIWLDEDDKDQKRPGIPQFLEGLVLKADGENHPLGSVRLLEESTAPSGSPYYLYNFTEDNGVSASVVDSGGGIWEISLDGLAKYDGDHEIQYTLDEAVFPNYRSAIRLTDGVYEITNTYFPDPTPTLTPTPVPTSTPVPADLEWFRLHLEEMETLPRTGF